ncbi:MAG: hypothetical protein QJR02_08000 [Sinobacteraceae bacterium]|nr:hypothetical protein [Nevskiaceae bacterium]
MKVHLLYRERDFDWQWALLATAEREAARSGRRNYRSEDFDPRAGLPWNAESLIADLSLETLFAAMAGDDDCIYTVARKAILAGVKSELATVRYRQRVLQDSLAHAEIVRELYAIAVEAVSQQRWRYYYRALSPHYPEAVRRDSIEQMTLFVESLKKLRRVADAHADKFESDGYTAFFTMLKRDLDEPYFARIESHLEALKFRNGLHLSAELGKANKGQRYVLHRLAPRRRGLREWWKGWFAEKPVSYSFDIAPRDEAGAQALNELRNRGVALAASALRQAVDHVRDFFGSLRVELAFYVGCINLRERLAQEGKPVCIPTPAGIAERRLSFQDLYDVPLALTAGRAVIGNDANANGKDLCIITGPNTGGKSTFLRSVGVAQLMMQAGMFVPAKVYCGSLCDGLFTHFKREEDVVIARGKYDEELSRMSDIIDHVVPHAMILLNESFAATSEREGSEIARQIIAALIKRTIRVLCVTHMYELAHRFEEDNEGNVLFLRAERLPDGTRTFKIREGLPLPTSFGRDLYDKIFATAVAHPGNSNGHAEPNAPH